MENKSVIVLDSTYYPVCKVDPERAICLLILDKAYSIKDTKKRINSINFSLAIPETIVLKDYRYVKKSIKGVTKKGVKERDKYTCVYCGCKDKFKLTIDHVYPQNRWKELKDKYSLDYDLFSWENLVCSCLQCNQYKSNYTLKELGWPDVRPKAPVMNIFIDWEAVFCDSN